MSLGAILAKKKGIPTHKRKVVRSMEFKRISALERRKHFEDLSYMMTEVLKTPGGSMTLWPIQAITIAEAFDNGGALGCIRVGGGKSLMSLLIPVMMEAERPLLLVPASLRDKTITKDIPELSKHWHLHDNLRIMSYSELSSEAQHDALVKTMPDLIIADECHMLRNPGAGRTRRFLRYMHHVEDTKFVGLSGTITKRSIRDYWHLVKLALREKSPLPLIWTELQDWADALDEGMDDAARIDPGALLDFCNEGESPRDGYRRRFVETPGIITTEEGAIGTSLIVKSRDIEVPDEVKEAFKKLRTTWCTPGGEEISDALSLNRHSKELSCGFYYKWIWPGGVPDYEWLDARKEWRRFVRKTIQSQRKKPFDTELQVAKACASEELHSIEYKKWVAIRDKVSPVTEAVWVSEFMLDAVQSWLKHNKGIVWIEHSAFGEKLKERGIIYYGAGDNGILDEKHGCVASINAHGTGKNLQVFHKNLFIAVPASGSAWEQGLGRTHRPGQEADEVFNEVFLHSRELWSCFFQARKDAAYIEATTGQKQKLQYASIDVLSDDEALKKMMFSDDPLWRAEDL